MATQEKLSEMYRRLYDHFGPQHWWPGESPFEVMLGAVLTQNTSWNNVQLAIDNLKGAGLLSYEKMSDLPAGLLAEYIRPAGYLQHQGRPTAQPVRTDPGKVMTAALSRCWPKRR